MILVALLSIDLERRTMLYNNVPEDYIKVPTEPAGAVISVYIVLLHRFGYLVFRCKRTASVSESRGRREYRSRVRYP